MREELVRIIAGGKRQAVSVTTAKILADELIFEAGVILNDSGILPQSKYLRELECVSNAAVQLAHYLQNGDPRHRYTFINHFSIQGLDVELAFEALLALPERLRQQRKWDVELNKGSSPGGTRVQSFIAAAAVTWKDRTGQRAPYSSGSKFSLAVHFILERKGFPAKDRRKLLKSVIESLPS